MKKNLYKYLAGNEYPGRGIVLGLTPDSKKAVVAYWIMGRSANSRNRVFEPIEGGIRTVAADPAKLEDPHLIIYNAVLTLRETTVVTNGDQTDTIARFMNGNLFPGYSFEAALSTRTYEDDAPNFTPHFRRGGICAAAATSRLSSNPTRATPPACSAIPSITPSPLPVRATSSAPLPEERCAHPQLCRGTAARRHR